MERPEGGFETHWCPTHKAEYVCPAFDKGIGCDDEEWQRECWPCLAKRVNADPVTHIVNS